MCHDIHLVPLQDEAGFPMDDLVSKGRHLYFAAGSHNLVQLSGDKVLLATSVNGVATAAVTEQNIQESREVAQGVANWLISLSLMTGIMQ